MRRSLALVAAVATCAAGFPVAAQRSVCDSGEARQLDFWVGDWDLTYTRDGKTGKSRNKVTKILGGCAVLEEFTGPPGTTLEGRSMSTFDRATMRWKQTWVDNTASYLDFTGGMDGDRMVFSRQATRAGRTIHQRMVFSDILPDSFKWQWQRSDDEGRNWTSVWEIDYRRVK